MPADMDVREAILHSWRINHRVTAFLFENLPADVWPLKVPGAPRRTVRMIAGHIHNARCMWVKTLTKGAGIDIPDLVNRHRISPSELLESLEESNQAMCALIGWALNRGGSLPAVPWLNLPNDIVHFVVYLATHEGHHRGQIVMLAREHGYRLPVEVTNGLWQWSARARETSP